MSEPCHALVFRDAPEQLCLQTASAGIAGDLFAFQSTQDPEHLVTALLRAGELECALADAGEDANVGLTTTIAQVLLAPESVEPLCAAAQECLARIPDTYSLSITRPEGFAFYGLHPLDYADATGKLNFSGNGAIVVIGIRSIGLTLGEVVAAALRAKLGEQHEVKFFHVRPIGHPYDRQCHFSEQQIHTIADVGASARIIIVDEGPGLSGSSFLSVGEALLALGVKAPQINLLCSRDVDPDELVTPNGAERWRRFQTHVVRRNHFKAEPGAVSIPAGAWRSAISDDSEWPGLWTAMLPVACCSADGEQVFEYHGLGRYARGVRERANLLAVLGFAERAAPAANGFSRINPVSGKRLSKAALSRSVLDRIAEYLAARAKFIGAGSEPATAELENATRFNFLQATGRELPDDFELPTHRVVISDSQMMPCQWLQPDYEAPLVKLDAALHGDGHFLPGPVDTAWDIAGALIEWEMDEQSVDYLIHRYEELASEDVSHRLAPYLVAYAAFRNGYCRMAASAMASDPAEQQLLLRDAARYREWLAKLVPEKTLAVSAQE